MAKAVTRTVLALVRMEVRDLTSEERAEEAQDGGFSVSEIPRLKSFSAEDIADGLVSMAHNDQAYAGSGVHLRVNSIEIESAYFLEVKKRP